MEGVPNDVVELIIAVDLNPSDPEEPINVNDVKVRDKGEGGEEGGCDCCARFRKAIAKLDPEMAAAVEGDKSDEEAVSALEAMADEEPEEAQDEATMFDKAFAKRDKEMM